MICFGSKCSLEMRTTIPLKSVERQSAHKKKASAGCHRTADALVKSHADYSRPDDSMMISKMYQNIVAIHENNASEAATCRSVR